MRLCIATPLYPPEIGGPATYTRLLEDGLPTKRVEVKVVKFGSVRQYPVGIRHILYFIEVLKCARSCDLILALDPVSVGMPTLLAARLLGKPYVVKIVGDYAWEQGRQRFGVTAELDAFVREKKQPFQVRVLRLLQRWVASGSVCVIVPSAYLQTIVEAWGISPHKIRTIYNAVEKPVVPEVPKEVASLSSPRVVTIGRLVPWKGMDGVIEAISKVRAKVPGMSLVVAGEGPERARLEAQATKMLQNGYLFTGQLSQSEVAGLLTAADVVALNSSYEGLSHVLIEALMARKVVIASRAGGNAELITHEHNGLLVDVGDTHGLVQALERVTTDKELATRLAENASAAEETFSKERMIEATYTVLAEYI